MGRILASDRAEGEAGQQAKGSCNRYVWFLALMNLLLNFSNSALETIWADFVLKNPLGVDVELTDLTAVVKEAGETQSDEAQKGLVEVEVIDRISLAPGEQRTVCVFLFSR